MAASSKKALMGAMAANLLIAATKFIVGSATNSTVLIAEGIHSLVDTGNSGLMLYGSWRSKRVADREHQFGYGMELYFWSLVVAMVVFGGGGGMSAYEGVRAVLHPLHTERVWVSYAVIVVAAIFEGISLFISLREFAAFRRERGFSGTLLVDLRASKDPAMFVGVLEDVAAMIGLGIAALGLTLSHFLDMPVFGGIASILIGVVLIVEAALLGVECRGLIIGESARPPIVAVIHAVIAAHQQRIGELVELRTLQLGPDTILVSLTMRLVGTLTGQEVQAAAASLRAALMSANRAIKHVVFELR